MVAYTQEELERRNKIERENIYLIEKTCANLLREFLIRLYGEKGLSPRERLKYSSSHRAIIVERLTRDRWLRND